MSRTSSALAPLFALVCLGIVYGSLYPFRLVEGDRWSAVPTFLGSWRDINSTSDIVGNIVLFLPYGYLAYLLAGRSGQTVRAVVAYAAAGVSLSLLCQLAQILVRGRDPSLADVYLNAIGGSLGGLLALWFPLGSGAMKGMPTPVHHLPLVLAAFWVASQLIPFVPTLEIQVWHDAVRTLWSLSFWSWPQFVVTVLSWLVCLYLLQVHGGLRLRPLTVTALAFVLLLMQVVIVHNTLGLTETTALFVALALWRVGALGLGGTCLALLLLVAYSLSSLGPLGLRAQPREFGWLPFEGYLLGSMLANAEALSRKLFLFGAIALLLVQPRTKPLGWTLLIALALLGVEYAQRYVGLGTPALTDPLLFLVLAWIITRHSGLPERRNSKSG